MDFLDGGNFALAKTFWLATLSFLVAILWTPLFTDFLYKNRLGKRIRQTGFDEKNAPIFYSLHKHKENTPTMGGLLIWITAAVITLLMNLNRGQTWLPLFTLVSTGFVGAADDLMNIFGVGPNRGGLRFRWKLLLYTLIALVGAWWFFFKLEFSIISVPWLGQIEIGIWYIPIFIAVLVFTTFSANETDGLDGLAGGVMASCFAAYGIIALLQDKTELAAFCGTILGALLAFLWFNVYPARFFMGDTGAMALGMTLGVIAFLTDTVFILPIIAFVLWAEGLSAIIQILSKKLRQGKKIFLSAPIHHHFQAIGWPEPRVTMRFWIISAVMAMIGLFVEVVSR
ncbi:MAG: phospho-N-acetylmuramoyl-pentapeptide-transferase [Candidatus Berkelbacteria bacterium]|nr:MAG: phospho-N-acetylmuramoyl-pentapeptide-transferase [Candidatus Berkelbacteria bacterium]QQG51491.1 MAG: phospho-N-acetylmuramoyl-pentapeptide-transferase [Candidatus Berkelbacteria bacterium]